MREGKIQKKLRRKGILKSQKEATKRVCLSILIFPQLNKKVLVHGICESFLSPGLLEAVPLCSSGECSGIYILWVATLLQFLCLQLNIVSLLECLYSMPIAFLNRWSHDSSISDILGFPVKLHASSWTDATTSQGLLAGTFP